MTGARVRRATGAGSGGVERRGGVREGRRRHTLAVRGAALDGRMEGGAKGWDGRVRGRGW
jgi:hypothetical protein